MSSRSRFRSTVGVKSTVSPLPESDSSSEYGICERAACLDAHGVGARRVQHGATAAVNDMYSRSKSSICAGTHWSQLLSQLRQFYVVTERNFFSFLPDKSNVISFCSSRLQCGRPASSTANLMGAALWRPVWLQ